ncbi:MAG TPA: AIR synthase-related protein, partial [Acidimicrobiales bacterium]|nr:AIR synthase-related protein [Acidimicrobiales bacterium]
KDLEAAHLRPTPRVREAEILRRHLPSAMVDVSDGFAADLGHLCASSGVGATVEAAALAVPELSGTGLALDPLELALYGGEDYELCFTIPADRAPRAAREVEAGTGTRVHAVGGITERAAGLQLARDGETEPLRATGWDHFRR